MLRTLYLKSIRDRAAAALIGVSSLWLVAIFGMWAYAGLGDDAVSFFDDMPAFYTDVIGINGDAGVAGLMLSMMFNFIGPFVVAGIAVSMGAAALAGEENDGTMNVLTTAPRSRSRLLTSKGLAALTVALVVNLLAWAGYLVAVLAFGESAADVNIGAATMHVTAVALLYGAVAFALGAATGHQRLASGIGTAFLVVSFFGAGLLPMIDGGEDWARIFPWYYINEASPLVDGVDWTQVLVILAVSAALVVVGWAAYVRRDLVSGATAVPLLARFQEDERLMRMLALLQGRSSTRGIVGKALSESRAILTIAGGGIFLMTALMGPMFNLVSDFVGEFADAFPDNIMAMVGFADYSRPEGWYHGEMLSITVPVAVAVAAIAAGAALAGEERARTISVLLGSPLSRAAIAWRRGLAVLTVAAVIAAATTAGIAFGNWVGGLGMSYLHILATGVLAWGLGAVLGGAAFLGGALTGAPRVAVGAGTGVAVVGWALTAFAAVNDALVPVAHLSPYYYYTWEFPLDNGLYWYQPVVLFGAAAALVAAGVAGYVRRDLKG
ncbi:ABC transporter permease subunit [Demequina gelatinilytica]|uniref:ABC transporter permease subunit n=1 Tax=Demequina gelatinilytica TaxID=1638980 RepID=UPI000A67CFE8|nr:ABC transporter permease subunit [Demequina gelatinilytica]